MLIIASLVCLNYCQSQYGGKVFPVKGTVYCRVTLDNSAECLHTHTNRFLDPADESD